MIVANFHVDDVNDAIEFAIPREQILTYCVEAPLFAGDDDICDTPALLEALWSGLYPSIAIEHRKNPIGGVPARNQNSPQWSF